MYIITATYKGRDPKYDKKVQKLVGRDVDKYWTNGKITKLTWERKSDKSYDRICSILGKLTKIKLRTIMR